MTVRCSNVLLDRYREDLEVYSGCSMCMQRKHLKSNMTYPPDSPAAEGAAPAAASALLSSWAPPCATRRAAALAGT